MLHFLKNIGRKKDLLRKWHIPVEAGYERIDNGDSIQYVNDDESRVLYFSLLIVNRNDIISSNTLAKQPTLSASDNGWTFKGVKKGDKEMLVCVFSFSNEGDKEWATNLFESIHLLNS